MITRYFFAAVCGLPLATGAGAATIYDPALGPIDQSTGTFVTYGMTQYSSSEGSIDAKGRILSDEGITGEDSLPNGTKVGWTSQGNASSVGSYAYIPDAEVHYTPEPESFGVNWTSVTSVFFDTLTFDFETGNSGEVSYDLSTHAVFNNGSNPDFITYLVSTAEVAIYRLDGPSSPFSISQFNISADGNSTLLSRSIWVTIVEAPAAAQHVFKPDLLSDDPVLELIVDASGEDIEITKTLSGSFLAEEGREYALLVRNRSQAEEDGPAWLDAMNTSSFSFTSLAGGTVQSASGIVYEELTVATVPLPAPLLSLGSGLALVGALRLRRGQSPVSRL